MTNTVIKLLNGRYSSRAISDEIIPKQIIQEMMEAIRLTPSCYNMQPWRFLFIESKAARAKASQALAEGNQPWASNASLLVVGYTQKNNDCVLPDGRVYHQFDLGMATMNLILAATQKGLIARPMAGFSPEKIKDIFELEDQDQPLVMLAIGIPIGDDSHLPKRYQDMAAQPRSRKAAEEIIRHIR